MCELFGASLRRSTDLREYLKEFYSHSINHPHGWGIMRTVRDEVQIIKEPECANKSLVIGDVIENTPPQTALLAHIRFATVGNQMLNNCHPFSGYDDSGNRWTLIHNGTIYSGTILMKYAEKQKGDVDSERIFLYLLDKINEKIKEKGELNFEDKFEIISNLARSLAPRNKLNFMIFDGEYLYVHKNLHNSLSYKYIDNGAIFSTQPLDDEGWEAMPMCRVLAFKDGEKVAKSSSHGFEFIPTLEHITEFDAMNI